MKRKGKSCFSYLINAAIHFTQKVDAQMMKSGGRVLGDASSNYSVLCDSGGITGAGSSACWTTSTMCCGGYTASISPLQHFPTTRALTLDEIEFYREKCAGGSYRGRNQ